MSYPDPMMASSREEYEFFLFLQQSARPAAQTTPNDLPSSPIVPASAPSVPAPAPESQRSARRAVLEQIVEKRKGYYEPLKRRAEAGEPLTETEQRILQTCEDTIRQLREL